jgi:hypothetical protein
MVGRSTGRCDRLQAIRGGTSRSGNQVGRMVRSSRSGEVGHASGHFAAPWSHFCGLVLVAATAHAETKTWNLPSDSGSQNRTPFHTNTGTKVIGTTPTAKPTG